jgi:C2H2-type zinc-finger domain
MWKKHYIESNRHLSGCMDLKEEMKKKAMRSNRLFRCAFCLYESKWKADMIMHLERKHQKKMKPLVALGIIKVGIFKVKNYSQTWQGVKNETV